ncbi:hypothetical protein [Elizabethkingia anophelis]|uniref:hypothetical protein n=1 Tax=Elizabethkingia anophelis TaxID=1117645 RepID=UPI00136A11F8|nr:hypothetical protein [Elizabethkingia anophelis]MYY27269.1 hypothetical protein [Elizabethkingia anophelis]
MNLNAQKLTDSISKPTQFNCSITKSRQKLNEKNIVISPVLYLRANNEKYVYAIMQPCKIGEDIIMYIKIPGENICVKKGEILEVQYVNGEINNYKNDFSVNCNGIIIKKFNRKEIKKITENNISIIKIYAYEKNYEFLLTSTQKYNISNQIYCLLKDKSL